jgi:hypothetical protein
VDFAAALTSLRSVVLRPEITVQETPAPTRLAPHSVALLGEATDGETELASGRFVVLHDPAGQEAWDGTFRVVSFVRAPVEMEMATDPALAAVAWAWLLEALVERDAHWDAPSGTVTTTASESFGALSDRPAVGEVEVRASWTPTDRHLGVHLEAWGDVLARLGGLPPLPAGVRSLPAQRRSRR